MIVAIKPLIAVIPRYGKWEPAVVSFISFAVASAVASLSTPLTNALNALGFIKTTLAYDSLDLAHVGTHRVSSPFYGI